MPMQSKRPPDWVIERISECLYYDDYMGCLRWKKTYANRVKVGDVAGTAAPDGRRKLGFSINRKLYSCLSSHIVWFLNTGEWPERIDHIDRDPSNDRMNNLRIASHIENMTNKSKQIGSYTSRFKGVSFHRQSGKWRARVGARGKQIDLGLFSSQEEAAAAYNVAAAPLHGDFAVLNSLQDT